MEEVERTAQYAKYAEESRFFAYSAYSAVRIFFLPVVSFQLLYRSSPLPIREIREIRGCPAVLISAFQLFSFQFSVFSFQLSAFIP